MGRFFQDQSKLSEADYAAADHYKECVLRRTGLKADELVCPREVSEMTPCVARDGRSALAETIGGRPICVGCHQTLSVLQKVEDSKGK